MTLSTTNAYSAAARVMVLFSVFTALILPVGYFAITYHYMIGIMNTSADINAELVSRLIGANPDLWRYESTRIEELLARRERLGIGESKRIYDQDNNLVADSTHVLSPPFITVSHSLSDNGRVVGRIEVSRTIAPIIFKTMLLTLIGLVFGYLLYRWLPFQEVIRIGRKLQESDLFLKETQRIARVGGWKANARTDYLMWTDGVYDICEASKEHPPAGLAEGLHYFLPEYIPVLQNSINHCLDTGEPFTVECRVRTSSGKTLWAEVRALAPLTVGSESVVIGTIQDINDRKTSEDELRKKNSDLEQFIYTVSHDLRSPLVTFKTFLGYLEHDMTSGDHDRVAQDLHFIHTAADKMKLLLDELLEISRIDHRDSPNVQVTLTDVLTEVLDALAGDIVERKMQICLPGANIILHGERSRFIQVWQNLVENAIKYSRADSVPRIEMGLKTSGGDTVFFVQDNGIGIDPQYIGKIFGIFEKLDPRSEGAGMGLSMVQRIVEKYGGRIWVESEGHGCGSCFCFTLPDAVGCDIVTPGEA